MSLAVYERSWKYDLSRTAGLREEYRLQLFPGSQPSSLCPPFDALKRAGMSLEQRSRKPALQERSTIQLNTSS